MGPWRLGGGRLLADIDVMDVEPVGAIDADTPLGETIVPDAGMTMPTAAAVEPMKARMGRGEPETTAETKVRETGDQFRDFSTAGRLAAADGKKPPGAPGGFDRVWAA
ncbi:MAG: hypothetical protein P4L76_08360 [Beijerinckiaceae bacterium]|nr:hypothetical protein [Beijerinckiaceae bacterium]